MMIDEKIERFTAAIDAFEADLNLAYHYPSTFSMDELLKFRSYRLVRDLEALGELNWMLRRGKAKIVIVED